ncbi:MAG: GtrA family protein [Oleiphilaceae bacterium]|nr:GtrA family protein [Oleiphilaceae bacterium]
MANASLTAPNLLQTLVRFVASGGAATSAHWATMIILMECGVSAMLATAMGACLGLMVNYPAQHGWAFQSEKPHRTAFPRYLMGSVVSWLLNLALFGVFQSLDLPTVSAQFATTALTAAFNFHLSRRFIFHD